MLRSDNISVLCKTSLKIPKEYSEAVRTYNAMAKRQRKNNTMSKANQQRQHNYVLLKDTTITKRKDNTPILVNPSTYV